MKETDETDRTYMLRAMELAERGKGRVNPNPLVGAVIVKEGKVIGEGWHEQYGGLHAERNAFRNCRENAAGATLYVTLEPCCHYGKTPPCTEAILEHKIRRVVIGLKDPNPLVAGKGIKILQEAGMDVVAGIEEEKLKEQNRIFLKYITTRRPWVTLKTAMTLDGKIAAYTGDSKWVTGEKARERVQRMRKEHMGIMVGVGTVMADDPLLTCRLEGNVRQPVRIVVDSRLRASAGCRLVRTARDYRTLWVCLPEAGEEKKNSLRKAGVEVLVCRQKDGRVDVRDLLEQLGQSGIDSLLLEGGGELNYSFAENGLIDEVYAFIAPKFIGGREAKTSVEGQGKAKMDEALEWKYIRTEKVGEDVLLRARNFMDFTE